MTFEVTDNEITVGAFWRGLASRPVGATVVAARGDSGPSGFLALSFAHVSAEPPVVLVSVGRKTTALGDILKTGAFSVNLLAPGGETLARAFGGEVENASRFEEGAWENFVTGAPVLREAASVFDCRLSKTVEEDSATVILGRVVGLRSRETGRATLAVMGGYRDF